MPEPNQNTSAAGATANSGDSTNPTTTGQQQQTTATPTIEEMQAKIDILNREKSGQDKANAALQKQIAELAKKIEETELANKTEIEKREYQLQKEREELAKQKNELLSERLDGLKKRLALENGLTIEDLNFIGGNTEDEITANVKTYKKRLDDAINKAVADRLASGSHTPGTATGAAATEIDTLQKSFIEAKNRGDIMAAGRIMDKINALKQKK